MATRSQGHHFPRHLGFSRARMDEECAPPFAYQPGAPQRRFSGQAASQRWRQRRSTHGSTWASLRCVRSPSTTASGSTSKAFCCQEVDRLTIDILFLKNVAGDVFAFLSQVDDATVYHVADLLADRSQEEVTSKLVKGWFRYFGFPDEMLLDQEGAMKSFAFEVLMAQAGVKVRFVPCDAHFQLGKAERHGYALRWIAKRLISQFGAVSADEMELCVTMALFRQEHAHQEIRLFPRTVGVRSEPEAAHGSSVRAREHRSQADRQRQQQASDDRIFEIRRHARAAQLREQPVSHHCHAPQR